MSYDTISIERRGAVALLTLNRPEVLNSWDWQQITDMQKATLELEKDNDIKVIILTGAGKGFSAGADLSAGRKETDLPAARDTEDALMRGYYPSIQKIMDMRKPVIAAVNGPAAGVGAAFAMAADLCIMSEKGYLMLAFSNIALVPDGGSSWLLSRAVGYRKALQYALEATKISADECLRTGLANKVVPAENLLEESWAWAEKLATRSRLATSATKRLFREAQNRDFKDIYALEAEYQNHLIGAPDNKEGIQAFLEKRAPKFK